ncbi:hypothetical protein BC831DRAFT_202784 [Entophlyctis helioformis]|nr:hypothetical protein BC831DRAFT_202784 [Entophlyctis helioformis]
MMWMQLARHVELLGCLPPPCPACTLPASAPLRMAMPESQLIWPGPIFANTSSICAPSTTTSHSYSSVTDILTQHSLSRSLSSSSNLYLCDQSPNLQPSYSV